MLFSKTFFGKNAVFYILYLTKNVNSVVFYFSVFPFFSFGSFFVKFLI